MATTCVGGGSPHAAAVASIHLAKHKNVAPSGNCATCTRNCPGVPNAPCTIHRGHEPPYRANGNPAAENRLLTFPAGSTRRKKNGTPRAPFRCKLHNRCAACSKL